MRCRCLSPILTAYLALLTGTTHGGPLPPGAVARLGSSGIQPSGSVAFSPDGKVLAVFTTYPVRKVQFWDTTTGARGQACDPGLIHFFRFVATADGCSFAVGGPDEIRFVDIKSGKVVRRFKGPGRFLECLGLSPDGKLLAAASGLHGSVFESHEIVLWDLTRGKELARLDGHKTWVNVLAFTADGKRLMSSSEDYERTRHPTIDGSICVWDVARGKLLRQFKQQGRYVSFSPDGKTAASRGQDDRVRLWDLETGRERVQLPETWMYPIVLPDGKTLALGGDNEMLGLWNLEGKKLRSFKGYIGAGVSPVGVSPDGKLLATIGGGRIRVWDVARGKERRFFSGHESAVSCMAFAGSGKVLVSGGKDMTVRVWDAGGGKELLVYDKHRAAMTAVACSPDGKTVASGDAANAVHLWDRSTGALRHRLVFNPTPPVQGDVTGITSLVFSTDGKTLFAASKTRRGGFGLDLWGLTVSVDPATGNVIRTFRERGSVPSEIAPDGRTVVYNAVTFKGFETESKLLLRSFDSVTVCGRVDAHMDVMFGGASFSSDGRLLAVHCLPQGLCGNDRSELRYRCWLWEVATGRPIRRLEGGATTMTFAPRSALLAGANTGEHGVRLFSAITGKIVGRLSGHADAVTCCVFSADGKHLATGCADGTILVWDATKFPAPALPAVTNLQPRDLDKLWDDLAGSGASAAYRAIWKLTAVPAKSLPLLRERLKPATGATAATIEGHIKDLDSKVFRKREQAAAALEKLGRQVIPALQRLLRSHPPLELRRRAERLLARLEAPLTSEQLRIVRSVTVLEQIGNTEARQALQTLARGAPGTLLTEEAQAALDRLKRLR